jgi:hypothetical protein
MRLVLLLPLLLIHLSASAQKQANIWYFGPGLGLDFTSGAPVAVSGGQTGTYKGSSLPQEGTSVISDAQGRLLCYTGGLCLWNRQHNIMPHGDSLSGHNSSTQSSVIIPKPGSNHLMYVFTSSSIDALYPPGAGVLPRGYRYTVVDMCLDSTRGDVVSGQKNILLADNNSEKLCACKAGGSNEGYWVLGHGAFTDSFFAWRLSASGLSSPVISQIGHRARNGGEMIGQMKFNAAGTKVAVTYATSAPSAIELFNFNNATGVVSNLCRISVDSGVSNTYLYSMEFSPDGSKLYVAVTEGSVARRIYQYDLSAGSCSAVAASKYLLHQSASVPGSTSSMQAGPDGKIYVFDTTSRIGCIPNPNAAGSAAGYNASAVSISAASPFLSFPNFIAGFQYSNGVVDCAAASIGNELPTASAVSVFPNPAAHGRFVCAYTGTQRFSEVQIMVVSLTGQRVFSKTYHPAGGSFSEALDLSALAKGSCLIRLDLDGAVVTKSVVVD